MQSSSFGKLVKAFSSTPKFLPARREVDAPSHHAKAPFLIPKNYRHRKRAGIRNRPDSDLELSVGQHWERTRDRFS
jgi:hypothetical protein